MLRAGTKPADEEGGNQGGNSGGQPDEDIAETGQRRTEREYGRGAKTLGQKARGNLKTGKRAREHGFHDAERGETQSEFALPDRQHHVDEVGIAVVQRMRAASDSERAALILLGAGGRGGCRHLFTGRRSTKVVLTKDITSSPCWLTPVERTVSKPRFGRLSETRVSITSLS